MVQSYHAAAPHGTKGTHAYQPSDFGLDAAELRQRFASWA
jgi:hypothetical protein